MKGRRVTSSLSPPRPGVTGPNAEYEQRKIGQDRFYEADDFSDDDIPPSIGHNSSEFDQAPEELITYVYCVPRASQMKPDLIGELDARDLKDAFRELRLILLMPKVPEGTIIRPKAELEEEEKERRSQTLRYLLRSLTEHHAWLQGDGGYRADLEGLDLREINLMRRDLSHANIREADLEGANLQGATLTGANLAQANLRGADLRGADLRNVDLSDANLQGAILSEADLKGVDLYRANLKGATIEPEALHRLLDCKTPEEKN